MVAGVAGLGDGLLAAPAVPGLNDCDELNQLVTRFGIAVNSLDTHLVNIAGMQKRLAILRKLQTGLSPQHHEPLEILGVIVQRSSAGGHERLRHVADAWHRRVLADDVVAHAFSHGFHPHHTGRLAAYWAEALGGPTTYSDRYGDESVVVRMHSGNGEHHDMDARAIACFDGALADIGLSEDSALYQVLHNYFAWTTMTTMNWYAASEDVPHGLSMPRWSWNGLQL